MREDRNFKASDVSGPSIWIFILCSEVSEIVDAVSWLHLKFLFNETAMDYGANTHFNTPEYDRTRLIVACNGFNLFRR